MDTKAADEAFRKSRYVNDGKRAETAWKRGYYNGRDYMIAVYEGRNKHPIFLTIEDNPYPEHSVYWKKAHEAWKEGFEVGMNTEWTERRNIEKTVAAG